MQDDHPVAQAAILIALQEDVQPSEYMLGTATCVIGRAGESDIVVPRVVVSRVHARIERNGPRYILSDAGSVNGTFVNEQPLYGQHVLADRDLLGFGGATPTLRFADPDPTTAVRTRLGYDERTMTFSLAQRTLDLPPTQFRLLLHLYRYVGQIRTREQCAEAIWGNNYAPGMDADALDRTINALRASLRQVSPDADLVQTRRGFGYVLIA